MTPRERHEAAQLYLRLSRAAWQRRAASSPAGLPGIPGEDLEQRSNAAEQDVADEPSVELPGDQQRLARLAAGLHGYNVRMLPGQLHDGQNRQNRTPARYRP